MVIINLGFFLIRKERGQKRTCIFKLVYNNNNYTKKCSDKNLRRLK